MALSVPVCLPKAPPVGCPKQAVRCANGGRGSRHLALGKLVLVNRKARVGRNPATGETIQIKAKRVVKFRVAKAAKDAILGCEEVNGLLFSKAL
jgi:hypothetical protein